MCVCVCIIQNKESLTAGKKMFIINCSKPCCVFAKALSNTKLTIKAYQVPKNKK